MPIEPAADPVGLPAPARRPDGDLVAVGADLEPGTVLAAYRRGLFPMPLGPGPARRDRWAGGRRYAAACCRSTGCGSRGRCAGRCARFEIRVDTAFEDVVDACADPGASAAGSTADIKAAYVRLHELGWAHSVEAWRDGELAGGLYGVAIGGLFAGESMFHRGTDASKVALVGLVDLLSDEHAGDRLSTCSGRPPHLATLGVVEIPREEYLARLDRALAVPLPAAFA